MAELMAFVPQSATITDMDRSAEKVRAAINAAAQLIPRLEKPHPSTRHRIRAHRTVPRAFIASIIAAVEDVETLQSAGRFDVADARETLQFIDAFRPVADQLAALVDALRFTIESRKARVVAAGLQSYAIARGLARDEENSPLTEHLSTLERDLHRRPVSAR